MIQDHTLQFEHYSSIALRGDVLTREECREVLATPDSEILGLLHAAYEVRKQFAGNTVQVQMLTNAKSGACIEDCHYCSQSSISTADIDHYGLLPEDTLVKDAHHAAESKAVRYCIVTSGRAPLDREVDAIGKAVRRIKSELPLQVCCSLGLLTEPQACRLKEAGVDRINHNLNTSERYHADICGTHTFRDRIDTITNAKKAGLEICSGGIIGMGENDEDIIDLAFALRDVEPDSIPINFLHPVEGTPLANCNTLTPQRCLKVLCLFRFLHPRKEIRVAGGREYNFRSLQPLALFAADSLFVDGYLTTPGQPADEAWQMIGDLGFTIAQ
ncbi:MAG TPA: biotin synthase BioB [Nitrospirales bacterium]|nr:biotin synthase BioB [Nitrospirales bacterium]